MPSTYPCLWFDAQAQEAAEFYTALFPNSRVTTQSVRKEPVSGVPVMC